MNNFDKRIARIRERLGPDIPPVVLIWQDGRQSSMTFLEAVEVISNSPGIMEAEADDPTAQSLLSAMLPSGYRTCEVKNGLYDTAVGGNQAGKRCIGNVHEKGGMEA